MILCLPFWIKSEFRNIGFWGEGKIIIPVVKPLGVRVGNNNKLDPHVVSSLGFEPRPHWWEMGAVTSVLVTLSIQRGYLMFTNQAQVWTLEKATQYFFFLIRLNCLPLLVLVGNLFREKSGFMLHFPSEKWNFTLIKQVLQIIRYDHLPCRFWAAW